MKYILTAILLFNVAFGQSLFGVVAGDGTFDPDAKRLIDSVVARGGNPTTAQRTALNKLYKKMKGRFTGYSVNYWTDSVLHFYIPIFGTASADTARNRFNGRNPSANHLTYVSTITFSTGGMQGNATSSYAIVNGVTPASLPSNAFGFGIYANTTGGSNNGFMGVSNGTSLTGMYPDFLGTAYYWANQSAAVTTTGQTRTGFHYVQRTASNAAAAYRNNSLVTSWTNASVTPASLNFFIAAFNGNGTPADFANQRFPFVVFTRSLSSTGRADIYNMINEFLTELGIN
jgi:hypothetical protein